MAQLTCKYCSELIISNTGALFTTYPWRHDGDSSIFCAKTFQWAEPKVLVAIPLTADRKWR
jgi:hypothetical protein